MISHIAAYTPNVVAEGPELGQGDTEEKPRPDPRASKIKPTAAIANAPATIAGQDTAEIALSAAFVWVKTPRPSPTGLLGLCIVILPALNATATAEE
jgi:hypothetical protein